MSSRLAIGCMSGTSLDGIDAALVSIDGEGLQMRATLLAVASCPLGELGIRLGSIAKGGEASAQQFAELALDLGDAHVGVITELLSGIAPKEIGNIALIAVHGQTLFHAPPVSLQLINVAPIAQAFGVAVGYDFRAADIATGGQGAPITPLADYLIFGEINEDRVIVNLGGFINFTDIGCKTQSPQQDIANIQGGDLCACNQLLDAVARLGFNAPYDEDGRVAATGTPQSALIDELNAKLSEQAEAGRSLGTGDELADWVSHTLTNYAAHDIAHSACIALAQTLATRINTASHLILAGGGANNCTLVKSIRHFFGGKLSLSSDLPEPVGVESREAMGMAVLGVLSQDRVPITLPQITGLTKPAPVAGSWTQI